MPRNPFDPAYEELPEEIPVFPLQGVLLLPGGGLPLNVFEKRYLAMTRDALRAPGRLIGMVAATAARAARSSTAPAAPGGSPPSRRPQTSAT